MDKERKLEKLTKLAELLRDDTITPSQAKQLVELLVNLNKQQKDELVKSFDNFTVESYAKIQEAISTVSQKHADALLEVRQLTNKQRKEHETKMSECMALMEEVKTMRPKDGENGRDGLDGVNGIDGKDGSPDTPEEIAGKLNTLDEVIDQKVIKGLTKKISDLSQNIAHSAVEKGAKLYTGTSETRVREIIAETPSSGGGTWGSITGTLSAQTDLQTALDAKLDGNGTATYVPFYSDANTLTSDAHFTYDVLNNRLHVHAIAGDATDGLIIESANGTDVGILGAANTANVVWAGAHNFTLATQDTIAAFTGAGKTLGSLALATYPSLTELSYVKGLTSAAQTQFTGKADTSGALTQFVGNNTWKVWYSDGSGDVQELALGADGTFLKSNGAAVAPSFATPAGTGDVTKVGTPLNNQIGVWTGDGTIEGDANLTWDGTSFNIATAKNFQIAGATILADAAGTTTLSNIDALDATTIATFETAMEANIDTLSSLTSIGTIGTGVWQGTTIKANYLQQAAADLGDADITVDLSNSNVGNVTNLTIDGTLQVGSVGVTGTRIATGFFTDLTVTNAISGSITGNAATATSATTLATPRAIYGNNFDGSAALTQIIASTYGGTGNGFTKFDGATTAEKTYTLPDASTTILTKNYTGALATGIVKNTTTTGELSIAVAGDFPTLNQNTTGSAATLTTTRTIWGQNFNGSANVTGDITLGTGNITMTGSIAATGARVTKGWFTDLESTNMPTVGGTSLSSTFASLASANAFTVGGHTITVANAANVIGLTINQNDTTNNKEALKIVTPVDPASGYPFVIENTHAGINGAFIKTYHNSASPANDDCIGGWDIWGNSSTGVARQLCNINGYITDTTNLAEHSKLAFTVYTAGTGASELELIGTALYPTTSAGLNLGTSSKLFNVGYLTTIELGHATANTLSASGGILSIEGVAIPTISSTDTLSNKTLTAPKFADLGYLADANGNELIILDTVTSAVNEITLANAATTTNPTITASGGDANVGLDIALKGTGTLNLKGNATQAAELRLYEDTDNGTNYSAFKTGAQAASITYTLPTAVGAAGTYLKDVAGDGVLSWATASAAAGWTVVASGTLGAANATLFDVSSISTDYDMFRITINFLNVAGSSRDVWLRFNNDSGANYATESTNYSSSTVTASRETGQTKIRLNVGRSIPTSSSNMYTINVSKSTTGMVGSVYFNGKVGNTTDLLDFHGSADWNNTSAKISRIAITDADGTGIFDTGSTYLIEGFAVS